MAHAEKAFTDARSLPGPLFLFQIAIWFSGSDGIPADFRLEFLRGFLRILSCLLSHSNSLAFLSDPFSCALHCDVMSRAVISTACALTIPVAYRRAFPFILAPSFRCLSIALISPPFTGACLNRCAVSCRVSRMAFPFPAFFFPLPFSLTSHVH